MSCGFCHVGPDPVRPPADPENPKLENLSSTVGAQYFWVDRIFIWRGDDENFIFQLMHTSRPGALDTSLITSDYINNPRTMNAVYESGRAAEAGQGARKETLAEASEQQAVQRLRPERPADAASSRRRTRFGRRTFSRTAPTRSACSARSTGCFSTSACSARNGRCISGRSSAASADRRSGFAMPAPTRPIGRRPRRRPRRWPCSWSRRASAPAVRRAGRLAIPQRRCRQARPRQGGVRRDLRAMPFEQVSGAAGGDHPSACKAGDYIVLEQVLGLDQDRRFKSADARNRGEAGFPRG